MVITDKLSLADFMWVRKLRNQNRLYMTGEPRSISFLRQLGFWLRIRLRLLDSVSLFLVTVKGKRAGYLLLREFEPGAAYITECVAEEFRGRQIGRAVVAHAKTKANRLIADIWPDNLPSIALHTGNGFVLTRREPHLLRYEWNRNAIYP